MRTRTIALTFTLAAAVVASGCSDGDPDAAATSAAPTTSEERRLDDDVPAEPQLTGAAGRSRPVGLRLAAYDDCPAFLDEMRSQAGERVQPFGLDATGSQFGWGWEMMTEQAAVDSAEEAPAGAAAPAATVPAAATAGALAGDDSAGGASTGIAGTNVQEQGVDEADIVKTDGRRIVTVSNNVLTHVDIASGRPVVTGSLTLDELWGGQMFLHGDHAYVVAGGAGWAIPLDATGSVPPGTTAPLSQADTAWTVPSVTVIDVDLSNPEAPTVAATLRIEGYSLSSRLVGGRLLLATSTPPEPMPWAYPQAEGDASDAALETNRQLVADSGLAAWTPQFEVASADGTTRGDLVPCERLHHPEEFAGFDVISLVELDLSAGLPTTVDPRSVTGVVASGQTVYASLDRFYVATTRWIPLDIEPNATDDLVAWSEDYETDVHAFSITSGEPVAYVGSGTVAGSLLNQFSMSEHEGYLRLLATDGSPWDAQNQSETRLVVLAETDGRLEAVGEVGGLGRGEALYSARMIGDRGFAVTFRQVDPFYVLDLSDPTAPSVTGELKIPGFSNYIHPVGEHRVLGLGSAASDQGQVTGFKLSLFDVSDPSSPVELSTWTLEGADSSAAYEHHAFQMIGSTAVVPIRSWGGPGGEFNGAILFDIGDTITELGRITHVGPTEQPTSDCRVLEPADLPDDSELQWMATDSWMTVQLCGANDAGGFGSWYCEVVPLDRLGDWFGDPDRALAELAAIGDVSGARLELCYRQDDSWEQSILRSVAADGTLYTMSTHQLHAHDLASLELIGTVDVT